MLRNTVLQQKEELIKLLALEYVPRDQLPYGQKILPQNLVKVITGPRRAGKSVFALLLLKDQKFGYLNFDDENLLKVKNLDDLTSILTEIYGNTPYLLFDEIQNLPHWELYVNKLARRGKNILLTGSNSKLLEKEMATVLTGRYLSITILPYSFKEYLRAHGVKSDPACTELPENKGNVLSLLSRYLTNGGFPQTLFPGFSDQKAFLSTLLDAVLFRDVVKRESVRFPQKISELVLYLTANFANLYSFNKLKNVLNFQSVHTLTQYLNYLLGVYLFFSLDRFSFKAKEQIKSPKKIYLVDNGFAGSFSSFSPNTGKLFENLLFLHLVNTSYQPNKYLFYYQTRSGKEVDFVLKKGYGVEKLIQAVYKLTPETEKREIGGLLEASQELKCDNLEIVNWEKETEEKYKGKVVRFIPLYKKLLEKT